MLAKLLLALTSLTACITSVAAIPTISAVGSKFFKSDGTQYYIKGVAYQLIEDDPLVDTTQCQLDANLMKELGANTIRVYHVDTTGDHSGCMQAFADAGIYLFVDLDSFHTYVALPDSAPSWTQDKSDAYRAIMDEFQQYDNTAGFFVGNEVLNKFSDAASAPFLLTAAADLKTYRDSKGYRKIPIGYSATDTSVLRPMLQNYVECRSNATERLDFYSLNAYEWCGKDSSYSVSGYDVLNESFDNYPVPIFLSETGCNTVPPRDFADQSAVLGPDMSNTWSGAIIYEWIQESNDYGLVQYGTFAGSTVVEASTVVNGWSRNGTPTPISPDFSNLQAQWATLTPTGVASSAYAPSAGNLTLPACPSSSASGWTIDPSAALPTMGQAAFAYTSGTVTGYVTASPSSSASQTATAAASATSTHAAGSGAKMLPTVLPSSEGGIMGLLVALMSVGAGFILWL